MKRFSGIGGLPQQASPLSELGLAPLRSYPREITMSGGSAKAIKFVSCDANGRFEMNPEAVDMLRLIEGPVSVVCVCVCGGTRRGTQQPSTKGIWLWSVPLKRRAIDGTKYNLLLLDLGGIDAYDQTETYSTQIFSLAVILSNMFIYNQMGGIDETALERLSLVTEMTKHILPAKSSEELGPFSPIFVWLLKDLDLLEDNWRITPCDYLEHALRPVQGGGKDVAAKNQIRQTIQDLFPDRECFTLMPPLSNETDLQHMDQIHLDKIRLDFRSGLDTLTRFVFERARPKHVGNTGMTGTLLSQITESLVDVLNIGVIRTITSSLKSVDEDECQRAFHLAVELYKSSFDRSKPRDEAALRQEHECLVQKSLDAFNSTAVGSGPTKQKYEKRLHIILNKAFQASLLSCSNVINRVDKELRRACNSPNTKLDQVIQFLDDFISKYEYKCNGHEKWEMLATFLWQSLKGPIHDLIRKHKDQVEYERNALRLKCFNYEDELKSRIKQLEAAKQQKSEYLKRYEDSISDKKRLAYEYMHHIHNLQSKCSWYSRTLDLGKQKFVELKTMYEHLSSKHKAVEEHATCEIAIHKFRTVEAEARLVAAHERSQSAQEEANEWKRRYTEVKSALENAASVQEQANEQTQLREDALRAEFSSTFAEKEREIRTKVLEIEQEKSYLEQKYNSELIRFEDLQERCRSTEKEALELAGQLEQAKRDNDKLERQSEDLMTKLQNSNDVEKLLENERAAREALSAKLQATQNKLNQAQQQLKLRKLNETASHRKRVRAEDNNGMGVESIHDMDSPRTIRRKKRCKSMATPLKFDTHEDGDSGSEDYRKFTLEKLKQELTKHNFEDEMRLLMNPVKKDIMTLYKKCILKK